MENDFEKLSTINVNEHTEKKEGLTYLSWAWAWGYFKKVYPDATYEIKRDETGLCYFGTPNMGYMVYTAVTAGGLTHEMWLPVMDGKNKTMKDEPYEYTTKYGTKTVEPISMFAVNKALMRCLVKNLAMFGLGLYIYAGEDLPDGEQPPENPDKVKTMGFSKEPPIDYREQFTKLCMAYKVDFAEMAKQYNLNKNTTQNEFKNAVLQLEKDISDKLKSETAEKSKKTAK